MQLNILCCGTVNAFHGHMVCKVSYLLLTQTTKSRVNTGETTMSSKDPKTLSHKAGLTIGLSQTNMKTQTLTNYEMKI